MAETDDDIKEVEEVVPVKAEPIVSMTDPGMMAMYEDGTTAEQWCWIRIISNKYGQDYDQDEYIEQNLKGGGTGLTYRKVSVRYV